MRFQQAVRGHFFVREPFQGFGAAASDEDISAATQSLQQLTQSQMDMKRAFASLSSCPSLDQGFVDTIQRSDADIDFIQAEMTSFLASGLPTLATITSLIDGHMQANVDLVSKMSVYNCDTALLSNGLIGQRPTMTGQTMNVNTGGGYITDATSGGGTTGGGGGGGGGGGMVVPPPVLAGTDWTWWLVGGALLGAMMLFSKNPPKLVAILGKKKTTRRKATRRTTTRRRR